VTVDGSDDMVLGLPKHPQQEKAAKQDGSRHPEMEVGENYRYTTALWFCVGHGGRDWQHYTHGSGGGREFFPHG